MADYPSIRIVFSAAASSFELKNAGRVSEPVHDGITDSGLLDEFVSGCSGPLGGDNCAGFVVAVVDYQQRGFGEAATSRRLVCSPISAVQVRNRSGVQLRISLCPRDMWS